MKFLSLTHARGIRDATFDRVVDAMTDAGWSRAHAESELNNTCNGHVGCDFFRIERHIIERFAERGYLPPVDLFKTFREALEYISKTECAALARDAATENVQKL